MKGILLHGGRGTRLRPLTHTGPKQLFPIANKPMSQYALEDMVRAGISEICFTLGDLAPEKVIEYYGSGERFGCKIRYVRQDEPLGIAHAISLTRDFVRDEPFVVYLGDNLLRDSVQGWVKEFEGSSASAEILLSQVKNPNQFGVARIQAGRLVELVEKPKEPPSDLALVGVYMFRADVFEEISRLKPSWRGELEITDAIQGLLNRRRQVLFHVIQGWWKDTGKPEDILEANNLVLAGLSGSEIRGAVDPGVDIVGNVVIGEGSRVLNGSRVRGPVVIGSDCTIGPGTYIGPYTAIGDNTRIEAAEIENSILVGDCEILLKDRITDSLIGRGTRISSSGSNLPKGFKLIVGENTFLGL